MSYAMYIADTFFNNAPTLLGLASLFQLFLGGNSRGARRCIPFAVCDRACPAPHQSKDAWCCTRDGVGSEAVRHRFCHQLVLGVEVKRLSTQCLSLPHFLCLFGSNCALRHTDSTLARSRCVRFVFFYLASRAVVFLRC